MQKGGMLNSSIAKVLADLGHTDTIVIGDCGLPVPAGVQKIDLALKPGTPSFLEVVEEVAKNMVIEKVEIAAEMEGRNPAVYGAMKQLSLKSSGLSMQTTKPSRRQPSMQNALSAPAKLLLLPM